MTYLKPLVVLLTLSLLVLGLGCSGSKPAPVIVIGMDGADYDLLLPWIEAGELPNLEGFLKESLMGELTTVFPILSPVCWASAATGVNPGKHGIYDFEKADPDDPEAPPILEQATNRRASPVWTLLSDANYKVGIVNIPMTFPPDPVNGDMISGFPYPQGDIEFTYPPKLQESLGHFPLDTLGIALDTKGPKRLLQDIEGALEVRGQVAKEWIASGKYDFTWVVFTASDKVQHFFWRYMDADHPYHEAEEAKIYGEAILGVWRKMDVVLGEVLAAAPPNARIILMSDHGFHPIYREVNFRAYAEQINLLDTLRQYAIPPMKVTNGILHFKLLGQLVGASDRGLVEDKMVELLDGLVDPEKKEKVVELVFRRGDLYNGATVEKAPDVIFQEFPGYFVSGGRGDPDGPVFADIHSSTFSAHHRPEGILAMKGLGIRGGDAALSLRERYQRGGDFQNANIMDVAPTLLALMGEVVPDEMDGRVLTEGFEQSYLDQYPVTVAEVPGFLFDRPPRKLTQTEKEALKSIPYIQ